MSSSPVEKDEQPSGYDAASSALARAMQALSEAQELLASSGRPWWTSTATSAARPS